MSEGLLLTYFNGMLHGGLGVALIIFGILGWPRTKTVLLAFRPKKRGVRPYRKFRPAKNRSIK